MAAQTRVEVFPRKSPSTAPSRRASQRHRLLAAISQLADEGGYTTVTVGQVIALAGVSRPTFYEYFTDKEECMAAALVPTRRRVLAGVRKAVASDRPEQATVRAVRALVAFAGSQPRSARLLMGDSLAGGRRLRDARDQFTDDLAQIIEDAHQRLPASAVVADLDPRLICGVSCRLLASHLYCGEPRLNELAEGLLEWIAAYKLPVARHRWQSLAVLPTPTRSPFLPASPVRAPSPFEPGHQRMADGAMRESRWLRIVFATADVICADGYAAASVASITEVAGVDSRTFYRLFAGKRQALEAANELLLTHAMAVAAGAFVAGETWPERVWEAARALIQYAEESPALTYVSLVESQAGDAGTARRVEDLTRAFTIFLHEGERHPGARSGGSSTHAPGLTLEMIANAVLELAYRHVREGSETPLSALLAQIALISLAPFLGAQAAGEFVCRQSQPSCGQPLLASVA